MTGAQQITLPAVILRRFIECRRGGSVTQTQTNYTEAFPMSKRVVYSALLWVAIAFAGEAAAGVDIAGPVQRLWVAQDGTLWFAMDTTPAVTYCKPGWNSMTMYVTKLDPNYPYYFAILATAATKGKNVYIGNISVFDGTTPCDIAKTGYGIVLLQ